MGHQGMILATDGQVGADAPESTRRHRSAKLGIKPRQCVVAINYSKVTSSDGKKIIARHDRQA